MTNANAPIVQDEGIDLLKVVNLRQLLTLIKVLAWTAIVLHLVYLVAASAVHHNGPAGAIYRLGTVAYAIATDLVLIGMAYVIDFFRKK